MHYARIPTGGQKSDVKSAVKNPGVFYLHQAT
ncbi:hypothetical protein CF65_02927 [Aggregatibacter actinomycetemcomitans HK1651]|nr:hypothetical protein CF65_02927 [Aggregatibacter actinomycetemcomitans HK1651]